MKALYAWAFAGLLTLGGAVHPVQAGDGDPLFLNLTTDDVHRSSMAVGFGVKQQARGHALTLFLNDKGVLLASQAHAGRFAEQQKGIAEVLAQGGSVIVCPMCMKYYGMQEAELMPGVKLGGPDLIGAALFKDNTRTLTW